MVMCTMIDPNIDPDLNYFDHTNACSYYSEAEFITCLKDSKGLSIIHFNCRSLRANLEYIKDILHELSAAVVFDVIGLSETWLKDNICLDEFQMDGFTLYTQNRTNKGGGGVALYVCNKYKQIRLEPLCSEVENCMETITVQIYFKNNVRINFGCVYRAPNTNVQVFNDNIGKYLAEISKNTTFVCGDFNIDMLQCDCNNDFKCFENQLYSVGMYPLISKPTRITRTTATLLDNIYTSEVSAIITSDILTSDITDHLPVFQI